MYGQREIAYRAQDKSARSKVFWEIVILRTINAIKDSSEARESFAFFYA